MEKVKLVSCFALLISIFITGCGIKKNKDDIYIDISLHDAAYSKAMENCFLESQAVIKRWEKDNSKVYNRKRIRNSDIRQLAVLGKDHMPDIFMTDCLTGRLLYKEGLLLDLSEYIEKDNDETFQYDDGVYAFPALLPYYTVLAYDSAEWKSGDSISADSEGLLSCIMSDSEGQEWFHHMIEGDKESSFTDAFFEERANELKKKLKESEPFSLQAFIDGSCSAVLLSGEDLYKTLEEMKTHNSELYERIDFSSFDNKHIPSGYTYGYFLNSKLLENPIKLERCIDLCRTLTTEYDNDVDETMKRLYRCLNDSDHSPIWSQYLCDSFWSRARICCLNQINNNTKTIREMIAPLQNYYEEYYLGIHDYSQMMDRYNGYEGA